MKDYKFFRIIVHCGHVGNRRKVEVTRYFEGTDIISCYFDAFFMPRSKKVSGCVKSVELITEEEYRIGKEIEERNLYLHTYSKKQEMIA